MSAGALRAGPTAAASLASFVADTEPDAIPADLRAVGVRHVLDVLGCGVAAVGLGAGAPATTVAVEQGGREQSSALGLGTRLPAPMAAFANGTRCHALDFDDTHEAGICHASTVVAPAALAVGEATGATGAEALDAYLLGCEVALRVAVASADGLYARGFHPTGVCGAFGAAAAASRLLGHDDRKATSALGIVGSFASGLLEYLSDGSATKPLHAGWAARAGVEAASLAAAGGEGPASVLDGPFGLLASHATAAATPDALTAELGERWETAELALKPFPACHFSHASTWAVAGLAAEHGLAAREVAEVIVRISPEGHPLVLKPLAEKVAPKTPYDAKFSLPYAIAHQLTFGELPLSAFEPARVGDTRVLELAARVRDEPIAASDGRHSRFGGGARIVTTSGSVHDRFVSDPPGSPRNPLDDATVMAKFRANAAHALPAKAAESLADAVLALSDAATLDAVTGPLRDAAASQVVAT